MKIKDCGNCAKGSLEWFDCEYGHADCYRATCDRCEYDSLDCEDIKEDSYVKGVLAGHDYEQQRIIALLEAEHNCPPYSCAIHEIIALIKEDK